MAATTTLRRTQPTGVRTLSEAACRFVIESVRTFDERARRAADAAMRDADARDIVSDYQVSELRSERRGTDAPGATDARQALVTSHDDAGEWQYSKLVELAYSQAWTERDANGNEREVVVDKRTGSPRLTKFGRVTFTRQGRPTKRADGQRLSGADREYLRRQRIKARTEQPNLTDEQVERVAQDALDQRRQRAARKRADHAEQDTSTLDTRAVSAALATSSDGWDRDQRT